LRTRLEWGWVARYHEDLGASLPLLLLNSVLDPSLLLLSLSHHPKDYPHVTPNTISKTVPERIMRHKRNQNNLTVAVAAQLTLEGRV